jgi:hypothetical protein
MTFIVLMAYLGRLFGLSRDMRFRKASAEKYGGEEGGRESPLAYQIATEQLIQQVWVVHSSGRVS